jgi:WD40 repeat protein
VKEMLELREIWGHRQRVRSVHFSPDGQALVSSGDDGTLRIWRVSDGQLLRLYTVDQGEIISAQYSPDGSLIALGTSNGFVGLISNPFSAIESVKSAESKQINESKDLESDPGKGEGKDSSKAGKSDGASSGNDSEIQEKLRDWAKKSPVPIPDLMINHYLFIVIGFGFLVFLVLLLILRRLKR